MVVAAAFHTIQCSRRGLAILSYEGDGTYVTVFDPTGSIVLLLGSVRLFMLRALGRLSYHDFSVVWLSLPPFPHNHTPTAQLKRAR